MARSAESQRSLLDAPLRQFEFDPPAPCAQLLSDGRALPNGRRAPCSTLEVQPAGGSVRGLARWLVHIRFDPLNRFLFSGAVPRSFSIFLLQRLLSHNVGPDQFLNKTADFAAADTLMQTSIDVIGNRDSEFSLHKPLRCVYTYTRMITPLSLVLSQDLPEQRRY